MSDYHTLSHTQILQFTLRADCDIFVKPPPRTDSANSVLKNWIKTANRLAYIARNSATETEPVDTVASGHVMSCCLATGSQKYSCVTSACLQQRCLRNERGAVRLGTARSSTSSGSEHHVVNTASPTPGAVWRHRGMSRITGDIPILLRNPPMGCHVTLSKHHR
jgi:hypothetical protein